MLQNIPKYVIFAVAILGTVLILMESHSNAFYITYALIGIAAAATVLGLVLNILNNLQRGLITVIGVAAIAIIFFIAYSMAPGEVTEVAIMNGLDSSGVKMVGGGITAFYILIIITIVAMVGDFVKSMIQG